MSGGIGQVVIGGGIDTSNYSNDVELIFRTSIPAITITASSDIAKVVELNSLVTMDVSGTSRVFIQ